MTSRDDEKALPDITPDERIVETGEVTSAKSWDANADGPISAELDKKITRQLDKHLMPWLFGMWLLAFIDRSNIGNARIAGLSDDLKLDANKFNIALAVFYISYICYDIPSNLIIKKFRAGFYLPTLLIVWGIISLCTGFVTTYGGLLAARFFLGLAEGGLLGGMIIYLAMFYRRHQLLYRITLFYCGTPLSGAFGGLLATGLGQISTEKYQGWPWIFIIEGVITVIYGLIAFFQLPHTPAHITFLTPTEKEAQLLRIKHDAHGSTLIADINQETFSWHWFRLAILNFNTLTLSITFFGIITPIYSFSLFLPTIISGLNPHYSVTQAQLLTVPPNFLAVFTVLLAGHFSDKLKCRGPLILFGSTIAAIGYILLIASESAEVRYVGTFFVAAGIFPCSPLLTGWLTNNLAPHYVRATGVATQIMIANCAAFMAVFTYLKKDAPRYITGHSINLGMIGFSMILVLVNITYCKWENRQRDNGKRDVRLQEGDEGMLGFRHPEFRYTI